MTSNTEQENLGDHLARGAIILEAFDRDLVAAKRKRNNRTDAILIVKARFGDEALELLRKMVSA